MKRSVLPLLLTALATLGVLSPWIASALDDLYFDSSMDVFLSADPRSQDSIDKLGDVMDDEHTVMVVLTVDDLFSDEGAQLVHDVGRAIETLDGIDRVLDLYRGERFVRRESLSLDPREWIQFESFLPITGLSSEQWRQQRESVLAIPYARDMLVSSDGRNAMSIVDVKRPLSDHEERIRLRDEILEVLEPFQDRASEIHVGAFPFIEAEVQEGLEADVRRFVTLLPILLAAILLLTFRSLSILATVVLFEAAGVGLLPILFVTDGSPINLYTAMLFPLVAGLQLTFLTHLLSTLRRSILAGSDFAIALRQAFWTVLGPSTIALVTTVLGLLALRTCDVGLVDEVGRLGSLAVVAVFLVTFGPIWVLVAVQRVFGGRGGSERRLDSSDPVRSEGPDDPVDPREIAGHSSFTRPLAAFLIRHRRTVLISSSVLVLACLPALGSVRTDLRAIEFLDEDSFSRQGLEYVDREMGGMNVFELSLDTGVDRGLQDYEALAALERIGALADEVAGITNVYTYAQVFAQANRVWNRDDPGSDHVPKSAIVRGLIEGVLQRQSATLDDVLYDPRKRVAKIFARTRDMPASAYLQAVQTFEERARAEVPEGMTLDLGDGLHSILESDRRIVDSQVRSLVYASLAVWLTLLLLLRSVRLASVALIASAPALASILALLGYAGIPLNSVTVMVAAILLGIAVDDSIHFLAMWRSERRRRSDTGEVLRVVLMHKLQPMACTTAVLIAGMGMFLGASFPPIADFGWIATVSLAVAFLAAILVLPALLVLGGRSGAGEGDEVLRTGPGRVSSPPTSRQPSP